jgi:hypothetical protein
MQIMQARWTGEYPRNGDFEPSWDTELRDDGGWLTVNFGLIYLPVGDYHVVFAGVAMENIAAVGNKVAAWLAQSTPTTSWDTRYRTERDAGTLRPKFTVSGFVQSNPGEAAGVYLNTKFHYANTADIDWALEVAVYKLN